MQSLLFQKTGNNRISSETTRWTCKKNIEIKFQILDHISVRKSRVNEINCNVNIILSWNWTQSVDGPVRCPNFTTEIEQLQIKLNWAPDFINKELNSILGHVYIVTRKYFFGYLCVEGLSKYMLDPSLVFAAVSYTRFRWEIKSVPICGKINFLFADNSIWFSISCQ